jgi:hypothetical protein
MHNLHIPGERLVAITVVAIVTVVMSDNDGAIIVLPVIMRFIIYNYVSNDLYLYL